MSNDRAIKIVNKIIEDLRERSGLDDVWYDIDPEMKEEIRAEWIEIVLDYL